MPFSLIYLAEQLTGPPTNSSTWHIALLGKVEKLSHDYRESRVGLVPLLLCSPVGPDSKSPVPLHPPQWGLDSASQSFHTFLVLGKVGTRALGGDLGRSGTDKEHLMRLCSLTVLTIKLPIEYKQVTKWMQQPMGGWNFKSKASIDEFKNDAAFERHDSGQSCASGGRLRSMEQEFTTNM